MSWVAALGSSREALLLLLRALELPEGARVVVPAYTFYTVPAVVEALGLTVVPAPIEPEGYGLDPAGLAPLLDGASAVIVIHPFGQVARIEELRTLCSEAGVPLVEDGSQATGAAVGGTRVGAFGTASTFSLVHGKNLQTFGGGLLATSDEGLIERLEVLLEGAVAPDPEVVRGKLRGGLVNWALATRPAFAGLVFPPLLVASELARGRLDASFAEHRAPLDADRPPTRLSDDQGHLGCLGLEALDGRNQRRADNATRLLSLLQGTPGLGLPKVDPVATNTYNAVAVRTEDARRLAKSLLRRGIDTRDDYMDWLTEPPAGFGEVLYLPSHPALGPRDMERLARVVRGFFG